MKKRISVLMMSALIANVALADDTSSQTTTAQKKQTTTATTVLASAEEAGTNASMANEATPSNPNAVAPSIKYTGFFYGPGLDFSAAKQAANNDQGDFYLHNRPKFLVKFGENIEAGIDTRFNIIFNSANYHAANDNYRLLATIKNVFKTDTFALGLIPRLMLPTSDKAHNSELIMAPELLVTYDYNPKNTRFSLNGGVALQKDIYQNSGSDAVSANAATFDINPWTEVDLQLTPSLQAMVAYWPDFVAKGNRSGGLYNDSNEIDVGFNWDFVKGWTLIPYVAVEPDGMAQTSSAFQNMQANLIVTGTVF